MTSMAELIGNSTLWSPIFNSSAYLVSQNGEKAGAGLVPRMTINVTTSLREDFDNSTATYQDSDSSYYLMKPTHGTLGFGIPDSPLAIQIVNYCFGVTLLMIGLTGFFGNGLVLYVVTRYRRLRGGGGPLILSLASGDLVVSLLHILPAYSSFNERWAFGSLGCSLYAASVGLCGLASLQTLSAIAADRYSVIFGRRLTWLAKSKTCVGIWILSLCLVLPPFFGWSHYRTEGMGTSCSWDYESRDLHNRLYYLFLLTFGFLFPVIIITASYVGILRTVWKQSSGVVLVETGLNSATKVPTKSDMKTAQVIFVIIACFLTAWTPYAIVSAVGQFGPEEFFSPLATAIPGIFAKASVIFNPLVYGLSHPHFRSALRTLSSQSSCWMAMGKKRGHHDHHYHHNHHHNHLHTQELDYEQNGYTGHHHHHHHHLRYHYENHKFGDRKCGLSRPWNCYDGVAGGSPQILVRDARNINRNRSTVWHFRQNGSSKTPSEQGTTTGQNHLCTTGGEDGGTTSNHTMVQLLDTTVTPTTTGLRDSVIAAVAPLSYHSSFIADANLVSSGDPTAVSKGGTLDEVPKGHVNPPNTRSKSWWRNSWYLSEPDLSLLRFIYKGRQGALNKRDNNNASEIPRNDTRTTTALAKGKTCRACSPHSTENGVISRSENCLVPPHRSHHQNHQLCVSSSTWRKLNELQIPCNNPAAAVKCPHHYHCGHHSTAESCPACTSCGNGHWVEAKERKTVLMTGIESLLLRKESTSTTASTKVSNGEKSFSRKRNRCKGGGGTKKRKWFGRLHHLQRPFSLPEQRLSMELNTMSAVDSMNDFSHDYLSQGQVGWTSSYESTHSNALWRGIREEAHRHNRAGIQTDSGITSDLAVIPNKRPLKREAVESRREDEKLLLLGISPGRACPTCSSQTAGTTAAYGSNHALSLDDGFYSSFI